jgi:hypothetical protein
MSELAEVELRRLRAITDADASTLEEMHSLAFLLCTPSGTVVERAQYLGGLVDGSIRYLRFEPDGPIECLQGDGVGAVRYRSCIDISLEGREPGHLECWHLDVYERDGRGRWQCRWSQATDTITD